MAFSPSLGANDSGALTPGAVCEAAREGVAAERLDWLARGFNLSGWLDRDEPRRPDLAVLSRLRGLGFTHVRLPVDGEALMPAFAGAEMTADRLRQVDLAVDLLLTLGYAVIVDMHPKSRFSSLHASDPERAYTQLETAWRLLAEKLALRDPERVFFELLNEPDVSRADWEAQAVKLAKAIRKLAPEHTLIYGPAGAQDVPTLEATNPLDIPNVVYAIHFYQPMAFTHQGLDWVADSPLSALKGVPFPLRKDDEKAAALMAELAKSGKNEAAEQLRAAMEQNWDDDRIAAALAPAAEWALRHRKPVIVDEFGVLARYADPDDRARWLRAVRTTAERYCFGWTHWDYDLGFGFMDASGQAIEPAIAQALLGK